MKKVCVIFLSVVLLWNCDDSKSGNNKVINKPFENESDCLAQHFYYGGNNKIFLDTILRKDRIYIGFDKSTPNDEIINFINNNATFEKIDESKILFYSNVQYEDDYKQVIAKTKNDKTCSELYEIITTLKTNSIVSFASYTYKSGFWGGGVTYDVMTYGDVFLVKVFNANDLTDLNEVVEQTNTVIKEQNEYMPDWFMIGVTKNSKYNDALKMSQYFFETGKFMYSYVDFGYYPED